MRRTAAFLLVAALVGCSDEGPQSAPGTLAASVVGPNGDEGAAVILVLGDGVNSVSPAGGSDVYVREGDSTTRIVVLHPTGGTLGFELTVDDVTDPPSFIIEEVAGPDDALRADVSAYAVETSEVTR